MVKKVPAKGKTDQVDQEVRKAILEEVKQDGYALEHADKSLKADREIVLTAIKQEGSNHQQENQYKGQQLTHSCFIK